LFLNESVGFAGIGIGPGASYTSSHDIYKTTDGGTTWVKTKTPAPIGTGDVTQINMLDSINGWASVIDYSNATGLWKTSDGGLTWNDVPLPVQGSRRGSTSVALTSHAMVVTDIYGPAFISTDSGTTFKTAGSISNKNCVTFVDDLHGAISGYAGTSWSITSDGGRSWKPSSVELECWSVYAAKGTSEFYASPESLTDILRSTDYGVTWNKCGTTPTEHAGHIAGIGADVLFSQGRHACRPDMGIAADGFFVSTDQGANWVSIGGPVNCSDVRFSVLPNSCGYFIWAFDLQPNGTLWKYQSAAPKGQECTLSLQQSATSANAGDTVEIPISIEPVDASTPVTFAASSAEQLSLFINTNFLTPIEFRADPRGTGSIVTTTQTSADLQILWNSAFTVSSKTTLGVLRCAVKVTDTTEALIVLSSGKLRGTGAECIAQSIPEDGGSEHIQLLPACGLAELVGFMMHGMIPEGIVDIRPNPASGNISIRFQNDLKRPIEFEVVNALGTVCLRTSTLLSEYTLDVSALPAGVYNISNGKQRTRFVKE
jgi:hypothetical protein